MKIIVKYLSDVSETERKGYLDELEENGIGIREAMENYSPSIIDAELAVYETDGQLIDVKIFDPYHYIKKRDPIYIGWNGWSNWLYEYQDNHYNTIDDILDEFNGETQD